MRIGIGHRIGPWLLGVVLLGVSIVMALVITARAYHHDRYRIAGIAISGPGIGEYARISRHALDCTVDAPRDSCRVMIDGTPLQVDATFTTTLTYTFRDCTVTYGATTGQCWPTNFTVATPYWAVVAGSGIGLPEPTVRALRWRHIVDSLAEAEWEMVRRPLTSALAIAAAAITFVVTEGRRLRKASVAVVSSVAVFVGSWVMLTTLLTVAGHID